MEISQFDRIVQLASKFKKKARGERNISLHIINKAQNNIIIWLFNINIWCIISRRRSSFWNVSISMVNWSIFFSLVKVSWRHKATFFSFPIIPTWLYYMFRFDWQSGRMNFPDASQSVWACCTWKPSRLCKILPVSQNLPPLRQPK